MRDVSSLQQLWLLRECRRTGPQEVCGLASFPLNSLSYCYHRHLTTGLNQLLVWPIRAYLTLLLLPHTNLSALVWSTAKQKIQIQNFSLYIASHIDTCTHTQILNGCYFHYTKFWISFIFHWNMGCHLWSGQLTSRENAVELLSITALEYNTILIDKENNY